MKINFDAFVFLGKRDDNDKLNSRIRKFYKKQDDLIDSLEEIEQHHLNDNDNEYRKKLNKQKRNVEWLVRVTLVCNCVSKIIKYKKKSFFVFFFNFYLQTLLLAKIAAAVLSKSLSIISSVVDSAVDSASACLLFWAVRAIKRKDPYHYPGGKYF